MQQQDHRVGRGRGFQERTGLLGALLLVALALPLGCASDEKLTTPVEHQSPWGAERTWALVPLANESGVTTIDTLAMSDDFIAEIEAVEGIRCVPLNRSIAAMRSMGLSSIRTDGEARGLMRVLQVDGLVVGSITAYDPYQPLKLGIAAQLYTTDQAAPAATDVGELTMAVTDRGQPDQARLGPSSQASGIFDASNHGVLQRVAVYAAGRHNPKSGLRAQVYTTTMTSYTRFVAHEVVGELLSSEAAQRAERAEVANAEAAAAASGQ
ncbi:MAG: hypothetical protein JNL80_10760 [Phycisphaerae bacterium]|nr:hypothetical protein [Phycisphaerae bacterium]